MAFGRSNSLSINTGATNNLFNAQQQNNTSQPAQTGGLFGSTSNAPKPGGLFGASTTNTTGQAGSGSSAPQQQQSQAPQTSSLFGGAFGQNQSQNQTGSTGGLGASTQNKPSIFGSFGQNAQQQQQQQTQQPSLFDQSTQQQPNQQSSLFGSRPAQAWGTSTTQQQQQPPQQQQQQAQAPSLLSASLFNAPLPIPLPGSLTMGQSNSVPSQTQPGVKIDITQLRPTTRFSDLHDDLKKQIEALDGFIKQQESYATQCEALLPSHSESVASLGPDVRLVESKLETVELGLENDGRDVARAKESLRSDTSDLFRCARVVENLSLPQRFQVQGPGSGGSSLGVGGTRGPSAQGGLEEEYDTDLLGYFAREVDGLSATADGYWAKLAEVEGHLGVVERSAMVGRGDKGDGDLRELAETLRGFEQGILEAAGKVGEVREMVGGLVLGRSGF